MERKSRKPEHAMLRSTWDSPLLGEGESEDVHEDDESCKLSPAVSASRSTA